MPGTAGHYNNIHCPCTAPRNRGFFMPNEKKSLFFKNFLEKVCIVLQICVTLQYRNKQRTQN